MKPFTIVIMRRNRAAQLLLLAPPSMARTSNWMSSLMVAMNRARMSCSRCRARASFFRKSTDSRLNVRHPNSMMVRIMSAYACTRVGQRVVRGRSATRQDCLLVALQLHAARGHVCEHCL